MEKIIESLLQNQVAAFEQIKTLSNALDHLTTAVEHLTIAVKESQDRIQELEHGRGGLFRN